MQPLADQYGRVVRYLRISITDRCNLRCSYCAPDADFAYIPHNQILSYEHIIKIIKAATIIGTDKVRFTGGEPFARKGFIQFLDQVRSEFPELDMRITTNATMLEKYVPALAKIGINALNISFDTFKAATFFKITGQKLFREANAGLMSAINAGLKVKINSVALKGVNDSELESFLLFAKKYSLDVRFIELMPLGGRGGWTQDNFWKSDDLIQQAKSFVTLIPEIENTDSLLSRNDRGPACMYSIEGSKGRLGTISPLTNHFCASCNRLRITSEGKLRTCLFSDEEYSLKETLLDPAKTTEDLVEFFKEKLTKKPIGAEILEQKRMQQRIINSHMSAIGG